MTKKLKRVTNLHFKENELLKIRVQRMRIVLEFALYDWNDNRDCFSCQHNKRLVKGLHKALYQDDKDSKL